MYPLCQVDHQLMCLSRLDVTGDGVPEVVACSWDGQTYIISQDSTLNNTDIDTLVKRLLSFRVLLFQKNLLTRDACPEIFHPSLKKRPR